jgi:hypothetical protein
MNFIKNKELVNPVQDRMAARIAAGIVSYQLKLAGRLNSQINQYTKAQQKRLLWLSCAIAVIGICTSLYVTVHFSSMKSPENHYQSNHIGMASDIPKSKRYRNQSTDSLTIKK